MEFRNADFVLFRAYRKIPLLLLVAYRIKAVPEESRSSYGPVKSVRCKEIHKTRE